MSTAPQGPHASRRLPVFCRAGASGVAARALLALVVWLGFACLRILPEGLHYTTIWWNLWQFLPREALLQEPLTSLWLLHAQPPALNALLALFLQAETHGLAGAQACASLVMIATGLAALLIWMETAWRILHSVVLALLIVLLLAINPAFDFFGVSFYYPNMVLCLLGLILLAGLAWARSPGAARFALLALLLCALVYTRSLWHPIIGVGMLALAACYLRARCGALARSLLPGALLFLLIAGGWCLKNQILFNTAGFSSWLGINIRNDAFPDTPLWKFVSGLEYEQDLVRPFYSDTQWIRLQGHAATAQELKGADGSFRRNMNHYAVPALNAESLRQTLAHYRQYPKQYLRLVWMRLALTDLPPYADMYSYNRQSAGYQLNWGGSYGRAFERLYYGGWLRPAWRFSYWGFPWRPGFTLVVLWPLAVIGALLRLRRWRRPAGFASLLMLAMLGWVWAMILLIDGGEGARMRWPVEPVFLILLILALRDIRFARRRRRLSNHLTPA